MNRSPVALISVTDKRGVTDFARSLGERGFLILSTGGTAKLLRDCGVNVKDVSEYTGNPEILDGRVKTLHPKIHAGILADRDDAGHTRQLDASGWMNFDLVVVNLYDFSGEARQKNLSVSDAIHHIDVGGPSMLRGAAKNHMSTLPVIDPGDYAEVLRRWDAHELDPVFRRSMAVKVFDATARYDRMIADYMTTRQEDPAPGTLFAAELNTPWSVLKNLRYGENPHQSAALLTHASGPLSGPLSGLAAAEILQGKELSYNNYLDLDAAGAIVSDFFPTPAVTIIKHTNPCGTSAGIGMTVTELFVQALSCDPKCAFGGIVAANVTIDEGAARAMSEIFLECVIAPDFTPGALAVFQPKKNLRILRSKALAAASPQAPLSMNFKSISGGILAQSTTPGITPPSSWTCVSKARPTEEISRELQLAMTVCKHVKSNAIVLGSSGKTIGVGAGQMSRIDSTRFAIEKAREMGHIVKDSVLASDAFFPFRDCVDMAASAGIRAIIQPGGSVRDQESIDAANEHGIVLMFSGDRYFKH